MTAPLLTVAQVAERLGVSDDTVRNLAARKLIGHVRVGYGKQKPRIRFTEQDVADYIAKQRVAPADESPPARISHQPRAARRSLAELPDAGRYQ